jgi:hypothetical protein
LPDSWTQVDDVTFCRPCACSELRQLQQLQAIVEAQAHIIDWHETETDRDNTEEADVPEDLRELEGVLEAAEAAKGSGS